MSAKALGGLLLAGLTGCSAPDWTKESWMNESFVILVDKYFPDLRIRSRNSHDLNRNLQWYEIAARLEDAGEQPITAEKPDGGEFARFTFYSPSMSSASSAWSGPVDGSAW